LQKITVERQNASVKSNHQDENYSRGILNILQQKTIYANNQKTVYANNPQAGQNALTSGIRRELYGFFANSQVSEPSEELPSTEAVYANSPLLINKD